MTWQTSTRRQRLPKDWPAIRRRILRRDAYVCHVCGQPGADQVDHIIRGDDHSDTNLAAIHDNPCHRRKSSAEGHAARPRRRRQADKHPGLL